MLSLTSSTHRIAVIGAGIAGLTCGNRLRAHGFEPIIFEKSRGFGGRLATRRLNGTTAIDHGAQYFTARGVAFRQAVMLGQTAGVVAPWQPEASEGVADGWYVGAPAMNAFAKHLVPGLNIHLETEVSAVERTGSGWRVSGRSGEIDDVFHAVISTVPAPQARRLLAGEAKVAERLDGVEMAPCWALMVVFGERVEPGFDLRRYDDGDVALLARNGSKPGRSASPDSWIVHASPRWSAAHLELEREEVAERLLARLPELFGAKLPAVRHVVAHCWRYARTVTPLGEPFLSTPDETLYAGGDWSTGARVESAFDSGRAMADAARFALRP